MSWHTDEYATTVVGDERAVFEKLVAALGLPARLRLPNFLESATTLNEPFAGMRLEVVGTAGTIFPASVSLWQPNEGRLTISLHDGEDLELRAWRHYEFSVIGSSEPIHSTVKLTLKNAGNVVSRAVTTTLALVGKDVPYARSVLRRIVDESDEFRNCRS